MFGWMTKIGLIFLIGMGLTGVWGANIPGFRQEAFYSGREYKIDLKLPPFFFQRGSVGWRLTAGGSQIASGNISAENPLLTFKVKELRPGVIIQGDIRVSGRGRPLAMPAYFFSPDPFGDMKEKSKILVWPEKSWTAEILRKYNIAFEPMTELKLDRKDSSRVDTMFLSQLDFQKNPDLARQIQLWAMAGRKVVILPPITGTMMLNSLELGSVQFFPLNRVDGLRREFDAQPAAAALRPSMTGNRLKIEFVGTEKGMGGAIIRVGRGMIVLSGWSMDSEDNPTPLYLLKHYIQMPR